MYSGKIMRKATLCIFLALCFILAGCSSSAGGTVSPRPSVSGTDRGNSGETLPNTSQNDSNRPNSSGNDTDGQKILIAYFTWAENTYVENPSAVDVDAVTSASVLLPGNTGRLAAWIQQYVGGDIFKIITEEPYSSDYDECLNRAIEEHDSGTRPKIKSTVENMDEYDVIFLGFPNWWYSCPMAILTFIESYDLSGKTIVPFCAHGTGGFAASLRDIGKSLPSDCTVLDALGVYRPDVFTAEGTVKEWLEKTGFLTEEQQ